MKYEIESENVDGKMFLTLQVSTYKDKDTEISLGQSGLSFVAYVTYKGIRRQEKISLRDMTDKWVSDIVAELKVKDAIEELG